MSDKLPKTFGKCPICGEEKTVAREAMKDEPSAAKGIYVSLRKEFAPILSASMLSSPMIKGILSHFDVCFKCGIEYCTKAEIASFPANTMPPIGGKAKN